MVPKVLEAPLGRTERCTFITGWTGNSRNFPAGPTEGLDTPAAGQGGDWEQSEESTEGFVE